MSKPPARYGKRAPQGEREKRIEHLRHALMEAFGASYQGDFASVVAYLRDASLVADLLLRDERT